MNKNSFLFVVCCFVFFLKDLKCSNLSSGYCFLVGFDCFSLQRKNERGNRWMTHYMCCKKMQSDG